MISKKIANRSLKDHHSLSARVNKILYIYPRLTPTFFCNYVINLWSENTITIANDVLSKYGLFNINKSRDWLNDNYCYLLKYFFKKTHV